MAGLFEAWRSGPEAPWLLTCCVITTEANSLMAPVHERMPVLIGREHWAAWLSRSVQEPAAIAPMLAVPPAEGLQAWPVASTVSRSVSEGPELIEALRPDGG
jgi:putative SOS response-associated peptidase YedK